MQINQNLYRIYRRLHAENTKEIISVIHADDFFCVFFMNY